MANISLDNLTHDPNFDFMQKMLNQPDDNDFVCNDSPYSSADFSCVYLSENQLSETISNHCNPSVMSINIQSLSAKFNDLKSLVSSLLISNCAPDVICLQEIWRIPGSEFFNLDGYHSLEFSIRQSNAQGGGVGIFVKKELNFSVNKKLSVFHERILESIFVDVTFNNKKISIGSLYRPGTQHPSLTPSEQFTQFCELFSAIADCANNSHIPTYIFGDTNIDCLKYGTCANSSNYVDMLFSHGMIQVVSKPTRCTLTSATLIDHVITNSIADSYETIILISQLSDHFPVLHFLSCSKHRSTPKTIAKRDFSDANLNYFRTSLSALGWQDVISASDPQLALNSFSETFTSLYDIHFPLVTKKFNKNFHRIEPWITGGLLTSRRKKIELEKQMLVNPSPSSTLNYKTFRNVYNKVLRAAKKLYFEQQLILNQSNVKQTWNLIRLAMNKKTEKSSSVPCLTVNNRSVTDHAEMANLFNDFFTSISSAIVNEINPSDSPPDEEFSENIPLFSFSSTPLTVKEVVEAALQLQPKKTLDFTGLSVWFVQKIINEISIPLHHIFARSLVEGAVPQQLKLAKVIPVFKSGKKDVMDNYRPISLLSCYSKIIEKIVCTRLTCFLDVNKLISSSQFGFRKKHSTLHPLIHFQNFVSSALDKGEHAVAIFCDLRKAFDTVDHRILLVKLRKMGVRGAELLWFQNYLTGRRQIVSINGSNSLLLSILIGVPQGSILGPLLFLIYINDLPLCSELFALLFADDTTLLLAGPNLEELTVKINTEFKKVVDFFRSHKLALHPEKTKFILFSNSSVARSKQVNISLNFNNDGDVVDTKLISPLTRITVESEIPAVKFLGVLIDPLLNFKCHIDSLIGKISKSLYFLRTVKNVLTSPALKAIYYSTVHSHFIYAIHIWSCSNQSNLNRLFLKQKMALRIVHNSSFNAHTEPLFKKSNILPLPKLIEYFKLQFMQRYIIHETPSSFDNMWQKNEERRRHLEHSLRNMSDFFIPPSRLVSTDNFPLVLFPQLWNNFDNVLIKSIVSKTEFNSKLKCYLLKDLSENVKCNRLLCPSCHLHL